MPHHTPHHRSPPPPPPPPLPPEALEGDGITDAVRCYFCGQLIRHEADVRRIEYHVGHGQKIFVTICPDCVTKKERGEGPFQGASPIAKVIGPLLLALGILLNIFGIQGMNSAFERWDQQSREFMAGKRDIHDIDIGLPTGFFLIGGGMSAIVAGLGVTAAAFHKRVR